MKQCHTDSTLSITLSCYGLSQLLRSGTSIGANVSESQSASSRMDFIHKLQLSLKESLESEYWLKLLYKTEIINEKEFDSLFNDCKELTKLLTSIIKTVKSKVSS